MKNIKGYIATGLISTLACSALCCVITRSYVDNVIGEHLAAEHTKQETAVVNNESTGETVEVTTGGIRSVVIEDGTELVYHIPEDHYDITDSYFDLLSTGTGASITDDSTVICGNTATVSDATESITATPYSSLYNVFTTLYDGEVTLEDIYTPVYTYHTTGELPENTPLNYTAELYGDVIEKDGVTYTIYNVNYDDDQTDYSVEEPVENIVHVQQLTAFSDTNDVVEISVFNAETDLEREYSILKYFIKGE